MIRKSGNHFSEEIMLNSLWVHDLFAEVHSTSADHALAGWRLAFGLRSGYKPRLIWA
jgi:hypothetical protein